MLVLIRLQLLHYIYENSCYLVEHIKATDATFLCSKSEVNWLKNKNVVLPISEIIIQNVYTGRHRHNFTNFNGPYPL